MSVKIKKFFEILFRIFIGIFLLIVFISIFILMSIIISNYPKWLILSIIILFIWSLFFHKSKFYSREQFDRTVESYDLEKIPLHWKSSLEELKIRRKVWKTLSEFFLDKNLDEMSSKRIFEIIRDSVYNDKQINYILWYEVAPVVEFNSLSVAGEWAFFDEQWLFYSIESNHLSMSSLKKIFLYVFQFFWRLFFFLIGGVIKWQDFLYKSTL